MIVMLTVTNSSKRLACRKENSIWLQHNKREAKYIENKLTKDSQLHANNSTPKSGN